MTYLYKDDNGFNFMNQSNYEQLSMMEHEIGDAKDFLTENLAVFITLYNDKAVNVEVPKAVNLKVAFTEPGIKGDRVSGATKPATLETGFVVNVPLHINEGDLLRIDTTTGEYVERVNQK